MELGWDGKNDRAKKCTAIFNGKMRALLSSRTKIYIVTISLGNVL
jgi:hypothetical protein